MARIEKRKTSYLLVAFEGYTADGKQIRRTKTWKPPSGMAPKKAEKEAMKAAILFEQQVQQGLVLSSGIKFEDFAKQYFEEYANDHLDHGLYKVTNSSCLVSMQLSVRFISTSSVQTI